MKSAKSKYVAKIEKIFSENASPLNAVPMKKYMKDKFEYFGIKKPERELITKQFFKEFGIPSDSELKKTILEFWNLPQREYQYFALVVLEKAQKKYKNDYISLFEELIVSKSWWDTVDLIAGKLAAYHFKLFPEQTKKVTGEWINSENIWLKRSALLFQLKYKHETDTDLLSNYIVNCLGTKEFFINKAIGWILREYSKTNAEWVAGFVQKKELDPLSRREALKWLNNRK